jgi:hypothetical protein
MVWRCAALLLLQAAVSGCSGDLGSVLLLLLVAVLLLFLQICVLLMVLQLLL